MSDKTTEHANSDRQRSRRATGLSCPQGQRERSETCCRIFARSAVLADLRETVGFVVCAALEHLRLHMAVALQVLERATLGAIDRDLMEIDSAKTGQLRVLI